MPVDWALPIERLIPYAEGFVRVLVVLFLGFLLSKIISRLLVHTRTRMLKLIEERAKGAVLEEQKRAATIVEILRKVITVLIWALATAMALREVGYDIGPLIAGAGIVGIAVGFGAQSLVRDVISGAFMLIENQIRVNDVVQINGTGGLVEELNLRTTVLRAMDGSVHIFPNGSIQTLSNMTRDFSYYVFDIAVAYKEDTDQVAHVMRQVAEDMRQEEKWASVILEPLEILGVERFAESAVIVKARIKTMPIQQWNVGRELNRRFKKKFGELGIEIPFPQVTVQFGSGSALLTSREELKRVIREVLAESHTEALKTNE
jgi:small conductance mechanosensitive channel